MAMLSTYRRPWNYPGGKISWALVMTAIIVASQPATAINRDQLWLPRDYYRYFRDLYKAAEISEQTERCAYVIAGTLSQERSTKQHPVFIITCRDQERQSFAYIVDGLSKEILNRPQPDPEVVAQRELQLKLEKKWLGCYHQLKKRTDGLRNTNLSQDMPEVDMESEDKVSFQIDFNATAIHGEALRYRAHCQYWGDNKVIDIHARLDETEAQESNDQSESADTQVVAPAP